MSIKLICGRRNVKRRLVYSRTFNTVTRLATVKPGASVRSPGVESEPFDSLIVIHVFDRVSIMHSVFPTQKSRDERLVIGWHSGAAAYQSAC